MLAHFDDPQYIQSLEFSLGCRIACIEWIASLVCRIVNLKI